MNLTMLAAQTSSLSSSLPLFILHSKFLFPKLPSLPKQFSIPSPSFSTATRHRSTNLSFKPPLLPLPSTPIPHPPQPIEEEKDQVLIDEQSFSRVFNIPALRVPAKDCFPLESRLRGHLLNWPRVRNVGRVPGDEVEQDLADLISSNNIKLGEEEDENAVVSVNRRLYGKSVGDGEPLYREKLAKTFNSRGCMNFRNLAKMSRPNQKKMRRTVEEEDDDGSGGGKHRNRKSEFSELEVVEDEEEWEDLKGLLGDEFRGRKKWRGSTRLLLLDERYGDKAVEELPQATQAAMKESAAENVRPGIELILESLLPEGMIIRSTFETVGHIVHLNLRDEHLPYRNFIAKVVLDKNKPKIQTVVDKIDSIQNDYRTMQLEVLAGNHSLVTRVVENELRFQVDLATVYWNLRLATERQRLLKSFTAMMLYKKHALPQAATAAAIVLQSLISRSASKAVHSSQNSDVFSGVGPIAISAEKNVKCVYANDLNSHAVEYVEKNSGLNKLEKKIKVFNMDGRRFIRATFASDKAKSITQVVMNLPKDAAEYLDAFRGILRDRSKEEEFTLPMIHVYGFSKAEDPELDFHQRIIIALSEVAVDVKMRRVRLVAPGKWMSCASFILPKSVAFAKPVLDM